MSETYNRDSGLGVRIRGIVEGREVIEYLAYGKQSLWHYQKVHFIEWINDLSQVTGPMFATSNLNTQEPTP